LREVNRYFPPSGDYFIDSMRFFSYNFYSHGFLGVNKIPAFRNAYKNISTEVFTKTYIALPLYFALRCGLQTSSFASHDELIGTISKKYPNLDSTTLNRLYSDWRNVNQDDLDHWLYTHFRDLGVFRQVFEADEVEVEKWFISFLNQTYDYKLNITS
jgi:hypothetical protein